MSALFLFRFDARVNGARHDLLLAYLSTSKLDEAEFSDAVTQELDRNLIPDEILLVIRDPIAADLKSRFESSPTLLTLKQRLEGKAVVSIRSFDANGKQKSTVVVLGGEAAPVTVEKLVRRAITRILRSRNGFVQAAGNYHFRLPSERHSERFLRIPNMLVDAAEISFLALGVLPYVSKDVGVAYIDTPSLFSVVAAISDHLSAFYPGRSPIVAENFRSYEGYQAFRFSASPEDLVLISASSSGRLASSVLQLTGLNPEQFVHLLYFGRVKEGMQIVCNVEVAADNPEGYSPTLFPNDYSGIDCPVCARGLPAVPLIGDHFELPGPQPIPLVIKRDDVSQRLRELMTRLVGYGVLSVGFGRSNDDLVARQFEVSPKALLSSLKASKRLQYVLAQAVPATVALIVCLNKQSMPFAKEVLKHVRRFCGDRPPRIIMAESLVKLERSDDADAVVVVAGIIESGRSLQDVSRDLRGPLRNAPQTYLTGLAKSRSDAHFDRLKSDLVQAHAPIPHQFIAIERMQLPPSTEPNAWRSELVFLNQPIFFRDMATKEKTDWQQRRDRLLHQSESMTDDLFLSAKSDVPLKLQHGFALWPDGLVQKKPTQADVYFTVASVLQSLRAAAEVGQGRALRIDLFQQTLLDPNNFGRFSDGIIQASILRAARPNELNYTQSPDHSRDMARFARRIVVNSDRPRGEAAAEFLIALGTKRLRLRPEDCTEVLKSAAKLPPRVERLRRVVSMLLSEG